jgi:hypothetical protein
MSNGDPQSLVTNPLLLGTGGSASGGASGDVATGWSVYTNDATGTCAKVARTDWPGEWQGITLGSATADNASTIMSQTVNDATLDDAGAEIYAVVEVKIGAGLSLFDSVYAQLLMRDAIGTLKVTSLAYKGSADDEITAYAEDDTMLLVSPTVAVPSGTTNVRLYIYVQADNTGAGTVYIGNADIIQAQ